MKASQIKSAIRAKAVTAVQAAIDIGTEKYHSIIMDFYGAYNPNLYIRTMQYFGSITPGQASATGSGARGSINADAPGYETGSWSAGKIYAYNMAGGYGGSVHVFELMDAWASANIPRIVAMYMK